MKKFKWIIYSLIAGSVPIEFALAYWDSSANDKIIFLNKAVDISYMSLLFVLIPLFVILTLFKINNYFRTPPVETEHRQKIKKSIYIKIVIIFLFAVTAICVKTYQYNIPPLEKDPCIGFKFCPI